MHNISKITIGLLCLSLTACNDDFKFYHDGEQHVRVYQDDQALSCSGAGEIPVETHGQLLIDEGIELHCSQKGNDGLVYDASCDSDTGSINIFTIHDKDLTEAESMGFSRLSTLPDAQFDDLCEFKVIPDRRKYALIHQLNHQYTKWQASKTENYQFQFHMSFSDCPTFAPTPNVTITVSDDVINTVYDNDNDNYLTNISDYMTIDELFRELDLQLRLTPLAAGLTPSEPHKKPAFSDNGVPQQYFIDAGRDECDAANYTITPL